MQHDSLPHIIQGGMGAGVSDWRLANAVSSEGQLGVVSGTGLDSIVARRLQLGDVGGHMRRALSNLPLPGVAQRIIDKYFVPGGKPEDKPFKANPVPAQKPSRHLTELLVASNFAEVFLAREGHRNPVGINYLEKIQLPTLPSVYGAMLAGVTWVLMGAGIPKTIPDVLDRLSEGQAVELKLDVRDATPGLDCTSTFDPPPSTPMARRHSHAPTSSPSSPPTPSAQCSSSAPPVASTASSSNTTPPADTTPPPRGKAPLSIDGEPVYGPRDVADLAAINDLGLPFWLAGSCAEPDAIEQAVHAGAAGVQIGTAFAYCDESGLDTDIKSRVLDMSRAGRAAVFTDPVASPTGFPFKVLDMAGTNSDAATYQQRARICDLGYLRHAYVKENGKSAGAALRTRRRLPPQRRQTRRHRRPKMRLQRPHGQHRPRPAAKIRRPGTPPHHLRR